MEQIPFTHFVVYHEDDFNDVVIAAFISEEDAFAFKGTQDAEASETDWYYVIDQDDNKVEE